METAQLIHRVAQPLAGIRLADLHGLRGQLTADRAAHEARLVELEERQHAIFTEGASRADVRGQRALAGQIALLDGEANQVAGLLRVTHKQILLLDHLIWLRESLAAVERLRRDVPPAVSVDWPALLAVTDPLGDDEVRLDELNDALELADGQPAPGAPIPQQSAAGPAPVAHPTATPVTGAAAGQLVVRVLDGGTIELATGQRVRYIGVDSPQMRNALGKPDPGAWAARDANRALVGHKRVRLEADQLDADIDGALWRYVYVGDTLINAALLRQGAVYYASRYPNNRLAEALLAAEQDARRHKRGVWQA